MTIDPIKQEAAQTLGILRTVVLGERLTEHQMKNIGLGRDPDAPLAYVALLHSDGILGTFKAHFEATSLSHARQILAKAKIDAEVLSIRIL